LGKIKTFNLKEGTRIGNYQVLEKLGLGEEGEVYKVAEVPTEAVRALKLFRLEDYNSMRDLIHYAWYYEQLQSTGHFPIYHHYGQWLLEDDGGCFFLVFELIKGKPLCELEPTEELFLKLAGAVARVHQEGYAVGDFEELTDVLVRSKDDSIVFLDCEPGKPDAPYTDYQEDCTELANAAKRMFGRSSPPGVSGLLNKLSLSKPVRYDTVALALSGI